MSPTAAKASAVIMDKVAVVGSFALKNANVNVP
jgi:hypothetical protein